MGIGGGITSKRNLVGLYDAAAEQNIIVRQRFYSRRGFSGSSHIRTHNTQTHSHSTHTHAHDVLMMPETGGTTGYFFFDDARDRGHH